MSDHMAFAICQGLAVTNQKESNHWPEHFFLIVPTRYCPHGEANDTPETPVMIVRTALHACVMITVTVSEGTKGIAIMMHHHASHIV
jgi:hypothetical protein